LSFDLSGDCIEQDAKEDDRNKAHQDEIDLKFLIRRAKDREK
jgi:hypothetical protein